MTRPPHTSRQAALLFAALLTRPNHWHYGYALMDETGLKSGSLYPLLIRLADDGYLEARWEHASSTERPRKEYRLTVSGCSLAAERLARAEARTGATISPFSSRRAG